MCAGVAEQLESFEDCAEKKIFSGEPEIFCERAEAVVVLSVQDAVGAADSSSYCFHEFFWHVGAGDEGENVDVDTFFVVDVERIAFFDVEGIQVAYLYDRFF